MWTRENLKQTAKQHLQGRYWSAFAVTLILAVISGFRTSFNYSFGQRDWDRFENPMWVPGDPRGAVADFLQNINLTAVILFVTAIIFVVALAILFGIFIVSVIETGSARWFSRNREMANPPAVGLMFSLFRSGNYMPTVKAQFWRGLFLFIWSLVPFAVGIAGGIALFVPFAIAASNNPGSAGSAWPDTVGPILVVLYVLGMLALWLVVINRVYAYYLVSWILGDNPTIGHREALNLSKEMTRGHKFDMFILDLSFIGWYLLGVIACGVGTLFVMPYHKATIAELYDRLRGLAVEKGIARMEDFGFVRVDQSLPETANPYPPMQ